MTFAARAARFVMVGSFATALSLSSLAGLAGPQSALAAVGAPSVESATRAQSAQSVQSAPSSQSDSFASAQSASGQSSARVSQRQKIVEIAESHIGAAYKFGAEGMKAFDCSGLVFRVFKEAGLADKISGIRRGAKGYYHWFQRRGLASRSNPKPGDLVIWHRGKHIGIYVGDGLVVSALNKKYGVRKTGISFVSGFTTYLHVRLHGRVPDAGGPSSGGGTGSGNGGGTGSGSPITVKTTSDHLVVRNGPGAGHRRIAVVGRGTTIKVTDKAVDDLGRKWVQGKLPSGMVGWVRARHVKLV